MYPDTISQDFGASHPDDLYDDDDDDDGETTSSTLDTLSELSTRAPSSASVVTPQGRHDLALDRAERQRCDWDEAQLKKPSQKHQNLDALVLAFKTAMVLDKKKEEAKPATKRCPSEVPADVPWLNYVVDIFET